jgi:hypothetical protein
MDIAALNPSYRLPRNRRVRACAHGESQLDDAKKKQDAEFTVLVRIKAG